MPRIGRKLRRTLEKRQKAEGGAEGEGLRKLCRAKGGYRAAIFICRVKVRVTSMPVALAQMCIVFRVRPMLMARSYGTTRISRRFANRPTAHPLPLLHLVTEEEQTRFFVEGLADV